jgi:arsenate reductase-like glutaredoxin family protein
VLIREFKDKKMKKIYHLSTCDTCRKIIKSLPNTDDFTLQNIKKEPLTETEIDSLKEKTGSYESLFSRKATLYKERGLKDQQLTEDDYKKLIMEHYTFLSRPVIVMGDKVFVGNSPKTVQAAIEEMEK